MPPLLMISKRQLRNATTLHEANFRKLSRVAPDLRELEDSFLLLLACNSSLQARGESSRPIDDATTREGSDSSRRDYRTLGYNLFGRGCGRGFVSWTKVYSLYCFNEITGHCLIEYLTSDLLQHP